MINYIKDVASLIVSTPHAAERFRYTRALSEELDRLDPRDFLPDSRFSFVRCRTEARFFASMPDIAKPSQLQDLAREVTALIERYRVPGSGLPTRTFRWLASADLKDIIVRDYAELSNVLLPDGAWKSTVIMAGSIVEAILFDLLTEDPGRLTTAKSSSRAPRDKSGSLKNEADWTLYNLIEIATDIGMIPPDRAKTFDQTLRDYRNFVHPKKELRAAHACNEGEALLAKGALDALCDHFDRTLP